MASSPDPSGNGAITWVKPPGLATGSACCLNDFISHHPEQTSVSLQESVEAVQMLYTINLVANLAVLSTVLTVIS